MDQTTTTLPPPPATTSAPTPLSAADANLVAAEAVVTAIYVEDDAAAVANYIDMLDEETAAEMEWLNQFFVAIEEEILDLACTSKTGTDRVQCDVEATSALSKPFGIESIVDAWTVTFTDTNVTGLSYRLGDAPRCLCVPSRSRA